MPIDFPSAPIVGRFYSYGGVTYVFTAAGIWAQAGVAYATLASPVFRGSPTAPTPTPSTDETTRVATTQFVWDIAPAVSQMPIGVTDGSTAAPGRVGEVIEMIQQGNATPPTAWYGVGTGDNVYTTNSQVTLTPGEWLIDMSMQYFCSGTGTSPSSASILTYISDLNNAPPSAAMFPTGAVAYYASQMIYSFGEYTNKVRYLARNAIPKTYYCVAWHNAVGTSTYVSSHSHARRIR
jgi:hypothetical protein